MRLERFLYQAFLVTKEADTQIQLLELLKKEFESDNLGNAFNEELIRLIQSIDGEKISSEYSDFMKRN